MPRIIDFGEPYGVREFPDGTTDEEIAAEYRKVRPLPRAPGLEDYINQATRSLVTGAAHGLATLPRSLTTGGAAVARAIGYVPGLEAVGRAGDEVLDRPEGQLGYRLGRVIEQGGEAIAPAEVPELSDSFVATQIPEALGSGLEFLGEAFLTRGTGRLLRTATGRAAAQRLAREAAEKGATLGAKTAAFVSEGAEIGTLGAAKQFQTEYEKAVAGGADRDTAIQAGLYGLPIGATEVLPLGRMLRRLDGFSSGGFTRALLTAGKEGFEEALQEAAQTFASNAVEKGLYNEAKSLTDDLIPQAGAGGAAGFLLSTLTQALGAGARRLRQPTQKPNEIQTPPQQQGTATTEARIAQTQVTPPGQATPGAVQSTIRAGAAAARTLTPAERLRAEETEYYLRKAEQAPLSSFTATAYAESPRTETQTPSIEAPQLVSGQEAPVRVRQPAPDRLETEQRAAVIPPIPPAQRLAAIQQVVADTAGQWGGAPRIEVVPLASQLPPEILQRAAAAGFAADQIQGFTQDFGADRGKVWLVAENLENDEEAKRILLHETIGHSGVERVLGARAAAFFGGVAARHAGTELGRQVRADYGESPQVVGSEIIARLAERPDIDPSLWQRIVAAVRNWARRVFNLGISDNDIRVLLARSHRALERPAAGQPPVLSDRSRFAVKPASPAEFQTRAQVEETVAEPLLRPEPPPIQGAQVAGAAAQLGRVAEEAYQKRESAVSQLSGLAYERQQYKAARAELRRLTQMATGRLFQEGFTMEDNPGYFPDPNEGVKIDWVEQGDDEGMAIRQVIVGDEFLQKLAAGGENPNPENTKALQGEVYFEKEAHRLNNLRGQIDLLQRAVSYYVQLGVEEAEIEKIQTTINKLSSQATVLSEAQWNDKTIGERADEIEAANNSRPGLVAKRQALALGPVNEFFGRQVGGFRAFLEKAQQGLRVAAALRDQATTPEELNAAVAETVNWLVLPEEVKAAILSGKGLTDEQRGAAFASLASAFEDFDIQRNMMGALRDSRQEDINKNVRRLTEKIAQGKIDEGMAEVLVADALAALDGETGGAGTLQSQATAQALKERITAIKNFALNLGKNLETNAALFQWITNPQGPAPGANAAALGLDQGTLDMILAEVKKNPAFGSAVVTLINSADAKLAKLPIVQLENIATLMQQGETGAANAAAQKMISSAKARASLAATSQRQNLRELESLDIERQSLDEGVSMFNELAASPEFRQLRDAVSNSPFGLVEPMDVANNVSRTLRPFGGKELPSHPGVVLKASDSVALKAEDFVRVHRWNKAAQEHLDAYDAAKALYDADPAKNPSPSSLGFDLPTIRGLRDAVSRSVAGSAQELSVQDQGSRWKVPWLVRQMNKTSWFRQHDFVAKMVGGLVGVDLRSKLGDWVNHFLISRSVSQKYRDIPTLRHAAMKSHPEVQMNQALYRTLWNEIAHWGRIFGSPLRVGFVLPGSGRVVTAEDLALLKRETEFEEDLRRRVTETRPVEGVRLRKGTRELVRPGAFVGDRGLPRHLNAGATSFIADILEAYGDGVGFTINSDLSVSSTDPVVAFWNQNPKMLIQHVLDSTRQDRAMRQDPLMAQAERTAAADWMANGVPPVQSVDELVTELVKHFPSAPGLNIRETVVKGLNDELKQYRDAAKRIDTERQERDAARNSKVQISFSADNEFTRPAAQLELPSELYDYGALTDTDHILIQSRANHERVVAYATALQRAINELRNRLVRYRANQMTEKEAFFGASVQEAEQVLGLLQKIYDDFDSAYKMGSPALTQGGWFREATGLLTSAVLALPTVNLRNMTQGQFEVYTMSRAMGLGGERLMFAQALLQMPKTLIRYALHIGSGLAKRADMGQAFLTGKNLEVFTKLVDGIAKMLLNPDYRTSADRIHELGFDTRDGFFDRMRRLWQASAESAQVEDLDKSKVFGRYVTKLGGIAPNAARALFDTIGVQESDLTINASLLTYATMLEKRLQEVAMNYGRERERQGLTNFDPTDPRWHLHPSEWSAFKGEQANRDSLGLFRLFMEQAASAEGFQLEKNLWEYYQKSKAGPARLLTERQFDAMERGLLAQFNASTPANRSSAAAGNNTIRNLLTLQGYVSDGMMKLINAFMGGSRDRTAISTIMAKLPVLAGLALMSVLIGYMVGALTGEWEKRVRGRAPSLPTPLDKDFYTSLKRWGEGTARLSLAQLFYLGDLLLAIRGEISGNRGFDPVGRVFPISIVQRFLGALRGMWKTQPQATLGERLEPAKDVARSLIPWYTELERAFGSTVNVAKQGERIIRGEAQINDLLPESRTQTLTGPQYGPTTIVRRGLMEAVSRFWERQQAGDAAGAAEALETAKGQLKKLEDYYAAKYTKAGATPEAAAYKARQDLWRDYQELNPVVAGMLGKRPTKAEWDLIRGGITGDRAEVVDNGIAAWQAGAQALFGRSAPITREDVAGGRGTGGGGRGGVAGIPSAIPRGPAFGRRSAIPRTRAVGGLRRVGSRGGRLGRGPRLPAARGTAPRVLRRRGTGLRSLRPRLPGIRRTTLPRVRRISAGRRRIGVVPRRRRRQAGVA